MVIAATMLDVAGQSNLQRGPAIVRALEIALAVAAIAKGCDKVMVVEVGQCNRSYL